MDKVRFVRPPTKYLNVYTLLCFSICVFIYSLIFPFYRTMDYLIGIITSSLITLIYSLFKLKRNLKGTGYIIDLPSSTGDDQLDRFIIKSQSLLLSFSEELSSIDDTEIIQKTNEIHDLYASIFQVVGKQPEKAPRIYKFIDYYLPTNIKLLERYNFAKIQSESSDLFVQTREQLMQALDLIIPALKKQLDALYHDEILDLKVDVEVLEKVLQKDGLFDSNFK